MVKKTSEGLVKYVKKQLGKPYWYGTFGQKSSEPLYYQKKRQYPRYYTDDDFKFQYNQKVHDCIGLIKGYMWSKNANDMNPKYCSNGCPDVNEEMMYNSAKVKGEISTMPDVPGICVLHPGHIGVYIGNGYVIEARGHRYGVVKTKLNDRNWTKWCECPYITYNTKPKKKKEKLELPKIPKNGCLKKGDIGDQVLKLQKVLNHINDKTNSFVLDLDGRFGPLTDNAVRIFQETYNLEVDGKFGPKSLAKAKLIIGGLT